ncbi:MAG TPA: sensor histidine kinase [Gaiellaceae bacterium]|nr:sensor histidine kinase [Gaiellaceae bacterium]
MIWTWLRRRPLIVDLGLVVLVGLPTIFAATHRPHHVAGAILVTAETLPLIWRRQRPFAVLLVVTAVAVLIVALHVWFLPFQVAIALYTLAATPTPRLARSIGLLSIVAIAIALAGTGHYPDFGDSAGRVVFLIAGWLLGDSIGSRRAYVSEIEEKAARLERERETDARRVVAEEQARIARELHDVVAHALSVIVVQAGAAREVFELDPQRVEKPITAIDVAARAALTDLRRVLGILHEDAEYEPQPGLARLDGLIEQVRATGLEVAFEIEGSLRPLPPTVDLSAYRIIQEALTNTIKHAAAEHARVSVRYGPVLELEIRDDGRGAADGDYTGHGMTGMRQRVAMLGGTVIAGSPNTGGYLVTARIPLLESQ